MTKILISLINIYQRLLSPDHSYWAKHRYPYGYCPMQPTCSEYAKLNLEQLGIFRSLPRIIWRLLKCNPINFSQ